LFFADTGIRARVYLVEDLGDSTIVNLEIGERIVKMRTGESVRVREGDHVHVAFSADAMHLFDAESGRRL